MSPYPSFSSSSSPFTAPPAPSLSFRLHFLSHQQATGREDQGILFIERAGRCHKTVFLHQRLLLLPAPIFDGWP